MTPLKIEPPNLNFGQVSRQATEQSRKITLKRGDGGALDLKLKPVELEGVQAALHEIEAGEKYELEVILKPPFTNRTLPATLTLETGITQAPTVPIRVLGTIAPRVTPQPKRYTVPTGREGDWEEYVRLIWDDPEPHKVTGASVDDPGLTVQVEEKDGAQQVVLKIPGDYKPKGQRTVTVETDDTQMPNVQIPVSFGTPPKTARPPRPVSATRPGTGADARR